MCNLRSPTRNKFHIFIVELGRVWIRCMKNVDDLSKCWLYFVSSMKLKYIINLILNNIIKVPIGKSFFTTTKWSLSSLTVYVNTFNFEVVRQSRFICSKKLSIFLVVWGNLLVSVRLNVTLWAILMTEQLILFVCTSNN